MSGHLGGERQRHGLRPPGGGAALEAGEYALEVRLAGGGGHAEELLGFGIIGSQIACGERPARTALRRVGQGVVVRETRERPALPLGLAAAVEVRLVDATVAAAGT